jgi:hypothetical protein
LQKNKTVALVKVDRPLVRVKRYKAASGFVFSKKEHFYEAQNVCADSNFLKVFMYNSVVRVKDNIYRG